MPHLHDTPGALKALQDSIYRERVLRAREQTESERLADCFEITNAVFDRMHYGAMWQLGITDPDEGWVEVRRRLDRLRRVQDHKRFVDRKPEPQDS